MKDKIKDILIDRLGQIVKDDVLDDLSTEIDNMVRHGEFIKSVKANITISELIDDTARVGDIFKYWGDYYEITEDNLDCGFNEGNCDSCPLNKYGCMNLKGFKKL